MSIVFKGKKGAGTITVEGGTATVGTSSRCNLVLEDPMAADRHLAFHEREGKFFVEDLETSSGTYLNGLEVAGSTQIPDEGEVSIVLGVSRLLASLDKDKKVLTVNVKEASFFFDKKEDPLAWVRSEVEFGRFRPVSLGNWFAAAVCALLVLVALIPATSRPLIDLGPLSSIHAGKLEAIGHGGTCADCHSSFSGVTVERCGACHPEKIDPGTHPRTWKDHACVPCHTEHRGNELKYLTSVPTEATCGHCHDKDRKESNKPVPITRTPWARHTFVTFPHAAHLTDKAKGLGVTGCDTCHAYPKDGSATAKDVDSGEPRREFARIPYEICDGCHKPGGAAKTEWPVAWHGTDQGEEKCLACHATGHDAAMRTIERTARKDPRDSLFSFNFPTREHHAELTEKEKKDPRSCVRCHKDGVAGGGRVLEGRRFLHGVHVAATVPPAEERNATNESCAKCHQEQVDRTTLETPHFKGPSGDCLQCHTGGMGPAIDLPDAAGGTVRVTDFPHKLHLASKNPKLDQGCLGCHTLAADARDPHQPSTVAGASSCLDCHQTHQNIGGGSCAHCHKEGDSSYSQKPTPKLWPPPNDFSHKSSGHAGKACDLCHQGTTTSTSLLDLPIPVESDPSCRKCHIEEKARFHFR